jgi:predicted ferric reductase
MKIGGVPFGVYAIVQNFNFALKFQPQAFAGLTLIAWGQTLYYQKKWRAWTATVATIALCGSFALMELILILTLRVGRTDEAIESTTTNRTL